MRCAILSDIHSNLVAFQAVLADIDSSGNVDTIWCLGDIVGYGPSPTECIRLLRERAEVCVAGNHDWAAIEKVNIDDFNSDAAAACLWTGQQLSPEDVDYLASLPTVLIEGDFTLVHGSPRGPIWEYLLSTYSAQASFSHFDTQFCLVGHSHVALVFRAISPDGECVFEELVPDSPLHMSDARLIVNPGSVGQPRDGDPRASYAVYDSESRIVTQHRIPYDIEATQREMLEQGLPIRLATRLSYGW